MVGPVSANHALKAITCRENAEKSTALLFSTSIPSAPAHTERDPRGLRLDCRRLVFEPRTPLAGRIGRGLYSAQSTSIAMDRRDGRSRPIISRSARLGVRHSRRHPRSFETKSATDQTTFASAYLAPHGTILALFWRRYNFKHHRSAVIAPDACSRP